MTGYITYMIMNQGSTTESPRPLVVCLFPDVLFIQFFDIISSKPLYTTLYFNYEDVLQVLLVYKLIIFL